MFAGYAWKIVRINADESIRLIYNGTNSTARGASWIGYTKIDRKNVYMVK